MYELHFHDINTLKGIANARRGMPIMDDVTYDKIKSELVAEVCFQYHFHIVHNKNVHELIKI